MLAVNSPGSASQCSKTCLAESIENSPRIDHLETKGPVLFAAVVGRRRRRGSKERLGKKRSNLRRRVVSSPRSTRRRRNLRIVQLGYGVISRRSRTAYFDHREKGCGFTGSSLARMEGAGVVGTWYNGEVDHSRLEPTNGCYPKVFSDGAKVAVACETEGPSTTANSAFATTDEYGNFTVDLPSRLHATPNLETACSIKVLQLPPDSACRLPSSSYGLRLASSEDGARAYTTGVIRLQHSDTTANKRVQEESRTDMR